MTKDELIAQAKNLDGQIADIEKLYAALRQERSRILRQIGEIAGFEAFGIRAGDVIEVSHKNYRGVKVYRMRVEEFDTSLNDDYTALSMKGTLIKKDGTLGEKRESCHPILSEYSWKRI